MTASHRPDTRNIAIIAHVDHGKTTLVDGLMRQSGSFRSGEAVAERALDSNDLERERGITILSKCTSVLWRGTRINLVDTPGHADFGGEVERVLGMVDAVLLLVDAAEGPMPQTRFVTQKAFAMGLRALVVVNKIDRENVDPDAAVDAVFDLFGNLGATDEQLDFPLAYASAKNGFAVRSLSEPREGFAPLLDLIASEVPPAAGDPDEAFCMQAATLGYDEYLGYMAVGRVAGGRCRVGDRLLLARRDGGRKEFRVQKVLGFQGLKRFELAEAQAGDIAAVTGMEELTVGDTLTNPRSPRVLPALAVDAPTLSVQFRANDGPLAGLEGSYVTSRNLRSRLEREVKSNIALRVEESDEPGAFQVSGRGELHLSILIETMRREGFELTVSQPRVIYKEGPGGERLEPYEDLHIELDEAYSGAVIEEIGRRQGTMKEMTPIGPGRLRLIYRIPARGLIGYRSQFLTQTRGTGLIHARFSDYAPLAGTVRSRTNGAIVAQDDGESNTYALYTLQERGALFIGPGVRVYGGMIIGENARDTDLIVNPCRAKKLTNVRAAGADEKLLLTPPRELSLEAALEFIASDELVEVTPRSLRLRKSVLDHNARKRLEKQAAGA